MSKRIGLVCPVCGFDGSVYVDDDYDKNPYPIYCPECDHIFDDNSECHCSDCSWNDDGHCLIPDDDLVTLGEDCPYRGEDE